MAESKKPEEIQVELMNMQLHDSIDYYVGQGIEFKVTRVLSGWIYSNIRLDSNTMTATFVPFPNQF